MDATSYYDVLDADGTPLGSPSGLMTEADAIEQATRYVLRAGDLGVPRMARVHMPDEHGRRNGRTVLIDQHGTQREDA